MLKSENIKIYFRLTNPLIQYVSNKTRAKIDDFDEPEWSFFANYGKSSNWRANQGKKNLSQKISKNSVENAGESYFGISEIILSSKCILLFCSQKLHERELEFGIPNFPALERRFVAFGTGFIRNIWIILTLADEMTY